MILENIKDSVCPVCGAEAAEETKKHQHANGLWCETRTFSCGKSLYFSPNFNEVITISDKQCKDDKEVQLKNKKRKCATENIHKYIKSLDVDEDFKKDTYYALSRY